MTQTTSIAITAVLDLLGTISAWVLGQVGSIVTLIMAQPLLLIPIGVVMLFTIIATFRRLF